MNNWLLLAELQLPSAESFFSKLSSEHNSDENYTHAQWVWETFDCRTLGDYHDLYNRTDVLLQADVIETARKTCLRQYGLDPA